MANEFKIYERKKPGVVVNGVATPIQGNIVTRQEITVDTELDSATMNADTDYVQLKTTIAAFYLIGESPTAAADNTSTFLAAGEVTEEVVIGGTDKISVIAAA